MRNMETNSTFPSSKSTISMAMKLRISLFAPGLDRSQTVPLVIYGREEIARGVYRVRPLANHIYVQSVERYDSLPPNLSANARSAYYEFPANECYVYVGESKIVGSGLFALVEIRYWTVFLEYSGVRISCKESEIPSWQCSVVTELVINIDFCWLGSMVTRVP